MSLKLAFLILLSIPYIAVANQCYGFYSETHPKSFSLAQIGKWRSAIVKDIVECTAGSCLIWPQAFVQNFSLLESSFATSTATRLARTAQESMTEIERDLSSQLYRADLNTVIKTERQMLLDLQGVRAEVKDVQVQTKKVDDMVQRLTGSLDLSAFKLAPNIDFINEFQANFARLKEKYDSNRPPGDPELLTHEVMIGAGYSNLGSGLIITTSGRKYSRKAGLDAFTLLHPLTDNAIDKGIDVRNSMKKISEFLDSGHRDTRTETRYEGLVLDLIDTIFQDYPRDKHPLLLELLKETHNTQLLNSKLQKDPNTPIEKLIDLSIHKGGVTVLSLLYILKGGLTRDEAAFFYRQGAFIQMGDDLVDVSQDLNDGIRTAWTSSLKSKKDFKKTFQAFLNLQSQNEKVVEQIKDPELKVGLREDINLGFKMFMLSAFMNPAIEGYAKEFMSEKIPLSPKNVRSILFNSYYSLVHSAAPDARLRTAIQFSAEVLDMHFWGNQYKQFEAKQRGKGKPFSIQSFNPNIFMLKVEESMSRWGRIRSYNTVTTETFIMILSALTMANFTKGIPALETAHTITGFIALMSAIELGRNGPSGKSVRLPMWGWLGSYSSYIAMMYYQNIQAYFP